MDTLLKTAIEEKSHDVRLVEILRKQGVLKESDLQARLKSMPDDAEHSEYRTLDDVEAQDLRAHRR